MLRRITQTITLVGCLGFGVTANAGLITLTGQQLLSTPGVSFPTIAPVLNGTSLDFTNSSRPNNAILTQWDLFPAGAITGPTTIMISANFTSLSADQDPSLGLGDTNKMAAGGGFDSVQSYTVSNATRSATVAHNFENFASGPNSGVPLSIFDIDALFNVDATGILSVTSTVTQGSSTSSNTSNVFTPLNTAGVLSVFFNGQSTGEDYRLNTITVDSPLISAVPEPTTLALFGLGLAGLGFARKKKNSA